MSIKQELIDKLYFKSGYHGKTQRLILEILSKSPTGLTSRDLAPKLGMTPDLVTRVMTSLVKRDILIQKPARLFNNKAHGQQLIYFIND